MVWIIISAVLLAAVIFLVLSIQLLLKKRVKEEAAFINQLRAEILQGEAERSATGKIFLEDMAPIVTALNLSVNSLDIHKGDEGTMRKVNSYIDSLMKIAQQSSRGMQTRIFFRKELHRAVSDCIDRLASDYKGKISLTGEPLPALPPESSLHLFRVMEQLVKYGMQQTHHGDINIHCTSDQQQTILSITLARKMHCSLDSQELNSVFLNNRLKLLHAHIAVSFPPNHHNMVKVSIAFPRNLSTFSGQRLLTHAV